MTPDQRNLVNLVYILFVYLTVDDWIMVNELRCKDEMTSKEYNRLRWLWIRYGPREAEVEQEEA